MATALEKRRVLGPRYGGKSPVLMQAQVTGAAADTNIPVAGIKLGDLLDSVVEHDATSALPTDHTANAKITSDGNIQVSVTTATDPLTVRWYSL